MIAHPQKVRVKHITSKNGSFSDSKKTSLLWLKQTNPNKIKRTESTQFPETVPKSSIYLNPKYFRDNTQQEVVQTSLKKNNYCIVREMGVIIHPDGLSILSIISSHVEDMIVVGSGMHVLYHDFCPMGSAPSIKVLRWGHGVKLPLHGGLYQLYIISYHFPF